MFTCKHVKLLTGITHKHNPAVVSIEHNSIIIVMNLKPKGLKTGMVKPIVFALFQLSCRTTSHTWKISQLGKLPGC